MGKMRKKANDQMQRAKRQINIQKQMQKLIAQSNTMTQNLEQMHKALGDIIGIINNHGIILSVLQKKGLYTHEECQALAEENKKAQESALNVAKEIPQEASNEVDNTLDSNVDESNPEVDVVEQTTDELGKKETET